MIGVKLVGREKKVTRPEPAKSVHTTEPTAGIDGRQRQRISEQRNASLCISMLPAYLGSDDKTLPRSIYAAFWSLVSSGAFMIEYARSLASVVAYSGVTSANNSTSLSANALLNIFG